MMRLEKAAPIPLIVLKSSAVALLMSGVEIFFFRKNFLVEPEE